MLLLDAVKDQQKQIEGLTVNKNQTEEKIVSLQSQIDDLRREIEILKQSPPH